MIRVVIEVVVGFSFGNRVLLQISLEEEMNVGMMMVPAMMKPVMMVMVVVTEESVTMVMVVMTVRICATLYQIDTVPKI